MKTCPASEFGCSCNRCAYEPDDDLEALKQFNRACYTTSMFLILLAVVLGVFAFGLWFEMRYMLNTEPGKDGGLYRIRLEEAEAAIAKAEGRQ